MSEAQCCVLHRQAFAKREKTQVARAPVRLGLEVVPVLECSKTEEQAQKRTKTRAKTRRKLREGDLAGAFARSRSDEPLDLQLRCKTREEKRTSLCHYGRKHVRGQRVFFRSLSAAALSTSQDRLKQRVWRRIRGGLHTNYNLGGEAGQFFRLASRSHDQLLFHTKT